MSYQVLARKWRPQDFSTVLGQDTVVQALQHSLSNQRLHHAYLFSGTRGIGKTSIARIFAKALNCQEGIVPNPCNHCENCVAINAGSFMDLMEVDGASRTKVEDTRELMENVQYPPIRGRYKVYIIDEVHMLSSHSFNALLKTLEEPPKHAIFLLATTDPQRLPITVLSRCLQFHLKALPSHNIAAHLATLLEKENISHEKAALTLLAKAAQGSIRDALSLLDQAIAYGNGTVTLLDVQQFLGTVETRQVWKLLELVAKNDATTLFQTIHTLAYDAVDFEQVLEELLSLLHQLALIKSIPNYKSLDADHDTQDLTSLATLLTAEDIQLYYQICLTGRRDLPLAPTQKMGFEMLMLRMLTFAPLDVEAPPRETISMTQTSNTPVKPAPESLAPQKIPATPVVPPTSVQAAPMINTKDEWSTLLSALSLRGLTQLLATHCVLKEKTDASVLLLLDPAQEVLLNADQESRLSEAFSAHFNRSIKAVIKIGTPDLLTPAKVEEAKHKARLANAAEKIHADPHVEQILNEFNAKMVPDSIQYLSSDKNVYKSSS